MSENRGRVSQYYKDLYEERAAIMEYHGGISRQRAERLAGEDVRRIMALDRNKGTKR